MADAVLQPDARRWRGALLSLAALVLLINCWALLHAPRALDPARAGSYLAELEWHDPQGWRRIAKLEPGSPLAAAGVKPGDHVRLEHYSDAPLWRPLDTQESLSIEHRPAAVGEPVRRVVLNPAPDPKFEPGRALLSYVTGWSARLISLALAVLIVLQRPADPALRGLALALIASNVFGWYFLPGGLLHDVVDLALRPLTWLAWQGGLLWFALHYPAERPPWAHLLARVAFLGIIVLSLLVAVLNNGTFWFWWSAPDAGAARWLWNALVNSTWGGVSLLSNVVALAALLWRCVHARGALRTRLVWVTMAVLGLCGIPMLLGLLELTPVWRWLNTWQFAVNDAGAMLGALLLVWVVLRQRVFDFGLVLQRTVALSVVSTGLLTALGLGKWLTERLLHGAGMPRGLWADLLLALVVVGAFATVQRPLLARVDAFVFRRWHEAADALRGFIDRAAQVTEPALLRQRFVAAVDVFTAARGNALYVATPQGDLRQAHATLAGAPPELDANDLLAVELRHGTRRVDLTRLTGSAAAACAEWAFVMSVRGRVSGVLLVSPRPDGVAYRPEELAQLEDSARRIGLDLESLRVAELERELATLRQQQGASHHALQPKPPIS